MNTKLTKNYGWVLFDADETLFHFDAFNGLKSMLSNYKVRFSQIDYEEYQAVNLAAWTRYQKNLISAQELKTIRFEGWSKKLNIAPEALNFAFLEAMVNICKPIDGAVNLVKSLKTKSKLGIVTNGFSDLQEERLKRTGLHEDFDLLVISEEIGFAKPHTGFFQHALNNMGNPLPENVLMVGDNLEADIRGGQNMGFHTCWFNAHEKPLSDNTIKPNFQVSSLHDLKRLLLL